MPERQPLTLQVRIEAFTAVLDVLTPEQFGCFLQLVCWIAVNAARLPWDFDECCHIVKAKTNADRATVAQVTGLTPLSRVTSRVTESVTGYGEVTRYGNGRQGLCFEGEPELGLTLRKDRDWGIDPLAAAEQKAKERQQIRDRVRKHRAKAGNGLHTPDGNGLLVYTRNSEDQIPTANTSLASLANTARVQEAGTEEGRRRGVALKAMRACGLTGINGADPRFQAVLAAGISDDELTWAAQDAHSRGKGFPYAVATLWGRLQDAAAGTPSSTLPGPSRLSYAEERARALAGPLAVGYKPPS